MNGCCDRHMCLHLQRIRCERNAERVGEAERGRESECLCVSACRWRGLAWQPDWHAGGVLPSLNAAVFCRNHLTSRCHSITWAPFTLLPQGTDGVGLNNDSTAILSFQKHTHTHTNTYPSCIFPLIKNTANKQCSKTVRCSSWSWLWQ